MAEISMAYPLPKLKNLPEILPLEDALLMDLQDGIPVLRASLPVQERIEYLLNKEKQLRLTESEMKEFDRFEEMDDFLSLLNRVIRNLYTVQER